MKKDIIENLINAVVDYGQNANWNDSEIIDTLIDCGITEEDFKNCGYGEYAKEYFAND